MLLLEFPAEILNHIFLHIDVGFFRGDLRRLTVSKLWYGHAVQRLSSELVVRSTQHLLQIANKLDAELLARIGPSIRSVDLTLERTNGTYICSCGSWTYAAPPASGLDDSKVMDSYRSIGFFLKRCSRVKSWRLRLPSDWACLMSCIFFETAGPSRLNRLDSLNMPVVQVVAEHLTSLEIDLVGAFNPPPPCYSPHRCIQLRAVLPTLRRFHCRMQEICPDLFNLDEITDDWPLEEVIINLSLQHDRREDRMIRPHRKDCPHHYVVKDCRKADIFYGLKEDIKSLMLNLRARLKKASVLRTIWDDMQLCVEGEAYPYGFVEHSQRHPNCRDILASCAMTGDVVKLWPRSRWDAKGHPRYMSNFHQSH